MSISNTDTKEHTHTHMPSFLIATSPLYRVTVGQLRFVISTSVLLAVCNGVGSIVGDKVGDGNGAAGLVRSIPGVQILSLAQSQAPAGQEFWPAILAKHDNSPPLLNLQGLLRMIH